MDGTGSQRWGQAHPDALQVSALGPVSVHGTEHVVRLSRSPRRFLGALIAAGPRGASSDQIADEVWGGDLPKKWRASLRMAASRVRKVLGPDTISGSPGWYLLNLSADQVDVWWLDELAGAPDRPVSEAHLKLALAGHPFFDVEPGWLLQRSIPHIQATQTVVVRRFCAGAEAFDDTTAQLLIAHQQEIEAFDDPLVVAIATRLDRGGFGAMARNYVETTITEFEANDLDSGNGRELLAHLVTGGDYGRPGGGAIGSPRLGATGSPTLGATGSPTSDQVRRPAHPISRVPPELEHLLDDGCYGRAEEIDRLRQGQSALIVGPSGVGKSRLLAEVSSIAVANGEGVSFVGAVASAGPYAPFLAAFPDLRELLLTDLDPSAATGRSADPDDNPVVEGQRPEVRDAAEARRSVETLSYLEALGGDARHWILIDDLHEFDSASKHLVAFLARARSTSPMVFVLSGRVDSPDEEWIRLVANLGRQGFDRLELTTLGPQALMELLAERLPELSPLARFSLARQLIGRNAGLPQVARQLIESIDPATISFDERAASYDPEGWIQPAVGLDEEVLEVAVAAAVLGAVFTVGDLIDLLDGDVTEQGIGDALDRLWERGRIVEGGQLDQFRFSNALVRDAFVLHAAPFERRTLHARAALLTDDLHASAHHQAESVPLIDKSVAAEAQIASAQQFMRRGSWHDALSRLRSADRLLDGSLDVADLIVMATALDLSGANGQGPRRRAFDLASRSGRWDAALSAALSGLPEAERPDGDPERIAMLEAIPSAEIAANSRFARAEALARQYALDGKPAEAAAWASATASLAAGTSLAARAEIAAWSASHHIRADSLCFAEHQPGVLETSDELRILQMQTISALEAGDYEQGIRIQRRFTVLADGFGNPARIWQGKVLDAAIEFDQGRWANSASLADAAVDYGTRHGMRLAMLVRVGQRFHELWQREEHRELIDVFEPMQAELDASSIASSSFALVLADAGRTGDAWRRAAPLVRDALDRPRSPAIMVLAMLAGQVAEFGNEALRLEVAERLAPFASSFLVTGYGIAGTGPVWRLLAQLASTEEEQLQYLTNAVNAADKASALTWRVITRRDLGRFANDGGVLLEASDLAAGTDLEAINLNMGPAEVR